MKKKVIMLMLCISVGVMSLAGCGNDGKESKSSSSTSSSSSSSASAFSGVEDDGLPIVEEEDVLKCLELGQYKGLELKKTVTTVTDAQIEETIASKLGNTVIEDEPCQIGDNVYISYVGKIDGKEFEGGSTEGTAITLGSSGYIDGFDDGVVGMKPGETKDLNLTFPDPYNNNKELSGKPVVFTVTVNYISRAFTELTDEWVQKYTNYDNVDAYRAELKKQLEEQAAASDDSALKDTAWNTIVNSTKIKQYQKSEFDTAKSEMEAYLTSIAQMMGTDLEGYKSQTGMSDEEFDKDITASAKAAAANYMIIDAIEKTEGFTKEDPEYKEALAQAASEYGMSEDELIESYGQDNVDKHVVRQRVMNMILDTAKITEVPAENSDSSSSSSEK